MQQFTERQTIIVINPARFIRQAISEKLKREKLEIKQKIKKSDVPF